MRATAWAVVCGVTLLGDATARADHYEVFLVAGQSNCDGRGKAAGLTGPLAKWAKPQDDVRIAYSCSKLRGPVLTSGGFQPLQSGWSVAPGKDRPTKLPGGTFGPEVSFGRGMADRLKGKKVALIKFAEGGTSLAKDWNPDVKDRLYPAFLDFTRKSLQELKDGGHTSTLRGMIWHQGESDAALTTEEYEKLLTTFVARVRADLGVPDLPFGVGEVFDNGKRDAVRSAQKATAGKVKGVYFVPADGLKTFDGGTHFDAASQVELGERFAAGMAKAIGPAGVPPAAGTPPRGYAIPLLDLSGQTDRQVVVDREAGQYLGHPTTVLLEDGKTILCVYPKGHGRGAIVYKRSTDGGQTWSDRLPTPASWATSKEVPTIHRVVDAAGKKRVIMWSGLYPARLAVSEDDGRTWGELKSAGEWGGIVVMGFVEQLKTPGHYLAMFHDDGRYSTAKAAPMKPVEFTLYKTFSADGGLTWSKPEAVFRSADVHLCEPGCVRSPDGKQLAVLLRENSRRKNSHVIVSDDEGKTWTEPRELPGALTGDRHTARYAPDGRLFVSFRDTTLESPTKGDWVAWVGTYEDIVKGREGQYRVRLMDNHKGADCAYPGVEVLPDGTVVTTTYGHWAKDEPPYVVSVRLKLDELDRMARDRK